MTKKYSIWLLTTFLLTTAPYPPFPYVDIE